MRARRGRSACSARIAAVVCRLARASSHLPSSTSVITTAEASKYRCGLPWPAAPAAATATGPRPALVPIATSRSMLPCRRERMPAGLVEARAEQELHRRRQHELQPGGQHPVTPNSSPSIGSTSGSDNAMLRRRGTAGPAIGSQRPFIAGLMQGVAGALDRGYQGRDRRVRQRAHARLFGRKVDGDRQRAGNFSSAFSTRATQEAHGMPSTRSGTSMRRDAVACLLNRLDEGLRRSPRERHR